MRILVVGASGNLRSHIARRLFHDGHHVRLARHATPLPGVLTQHANAEAVRIDLARARTLDRAVAGMDAVVYSAGKLFAPNPRSFLPITNTRYVRHIADAAVEAGVGRFILLSFPHIEEDTTPDRPGRGSLDVTPRSVHARTRLEAERYLLARTAGTSTTPIVLRLGMVYGPGVKMFEIARRLLRYRLLAVWRRPTWVHLIALDDCLAAVAAAVRKPGVHGIYNVCDEQPITLQAFLDRLADVQGSARPIRLPAPCFRLAAWSCERVAQVLGTATPLNTDIMRMGMTSVVADHDQVDVGLLPDLVV